MINSLIRQRLNLGLFFKEYYLQISGKDTLLTHELDKVDGEKGEIYDYFCLEMQCNWGLT